MSDRDYKRWNTPVWVLCSAREQIGLSKVKVSPVKKKDTTELYCLIPVRMTLTLIQGHKVTRKLNILQSSFVVKQREVS